METNDKNPGDKQWNNQQELNEGFSGENIPDNYNPSNEDIANRLKSETETDVNGNPDTVKRARDHSQTGDDDNSAIENPQSLQNRDRNYDSNPDRYPQSHPDNDRNRGNMTLDE